MPTAKKSASTTTAAPAAEDARKATAAPARTKTSTAPAPAAEKPARKTAAKPTAKTETDAKPAAKKPAKKAPAVDLPHLPGEDAWTAEEVAEVREELEADHARMSESIEQAETDLAELLQEGRDGAGLDPADVGSSNFERDQEMSLTANMRDTFEQTKRALDRLNNGSYGACESCGEPIGKGRLLAFPRATMCVTCKTREERR